MPGSADLVVGLSGNGLPMRGKTGRVADRLRVRDARGTVLDNLVFITFEAARQRLGLRHA